MDVSSENQDNIQDDVFKLRLDANGRNVSEAVQKIGPSSLFISSRKTVCPFFFSENVGNNWRR